METQKAAVVKYNSTKTCFINIPKSWLKTSFHNDSILVYEMEYGRKQLAYFTWSGEMNCTTSVSDILQEELIEISRCYAQKLNIADGQEVLVRRVHSIHSCMTVHVEPMSSDDWEILDLSSNIVQNEMLRQVRVVWLDQILPVWINKSVVIFFRIKKLSTSMKIGLLEQLTEIHVEPKYRSDSCDDLNNKSGSNREAVSVIGYEKDSDKELTIDSSDLEDDQPSVFDWIVNSFVDVVTSIYKPDDEFKSASMNSHDKEDRLHEEVHITTINEVDLDVCVRVQSLPEIKKYESEELAVLVQQPTTMFMTTSSLPEHIRNTSDISSVFMCKLTKVFSPEEQQKRLSKITSKQIEKNSPSLEKTSKDDLSILKFTPPSSPAVVILADTLPLCNEIVPFICMGSVLIPDSFRRHLGLEVTSIVQLRTQFYEKVIPTCVTVHSINALTQRNNLLNVVQNSLTVMSSKCFPLVAPDGMLLPVKMSGRFVDVILTFSANIPRKKQYSPKVFLFPAEHICDRFVNGVGAVELAKTSGGNIILPQFSSVSNLDSIIYHRDRGNSLGGIAPQIRSGVEFLRVSLRLGHLCKSLYLPNDFGGFVAGGLLVTGPRGSGKSSVASVICREVTRYPPYVYVRTVCCKTLKGKRIEAVFDVWHKVLAEAAHRAPSVVVLDDLDQICGSPHLPENNGMDSYTEHAAHALLNAFTTETLSALRVVLLATSASKDSLHPFLTAPRGRHFFQTVITIPPLNQERRIEVLRALIFDHNSVDADGSIEVLNLPEVTSKLEGSMAQDLKVVLDRAVHSAWSRRGTHRTGLVVLQQSDFDCALIGFIPTALKSVKCHSGTAKGWESVGGLHEVKKTLQEIFLWPTKFPKLFAQCPLQMSSGVLLYGPPGTGKTLLASVIAKECSLNFISIKGPELLSKYIGASEQAVRDLFLRAQAASPSILFFDEFDALAPRRGHDSTGVTDRVVNQLLTQLDGIEGRKGVYVLAATSRPDLIDPALLRPGRLDKCLHCPLPTEEEIAEILQVLSRPMANLDRTNVDFTRVAAACDNFSGADIQALLYNAQLIAIHSIADTSSAQLSRYNAHEQSWVYSAKLEEGVMTDMPLESRIAMEKELDLISSRTAGVTLAANFRHQIASSKELSVATVTEANLLAAASEMKPSVSPAERMKYQLKYETFVRSRTEVDFNRKEGSAVVVEQKSTLA